MIFVKVKNKSKAIPVDNAEQLSYTKNPAGLYVVSKMNEDWFIPYQALEYVVDTHKESKPREIQEED